MKKSILILLSGFAVSMLAACNMTRGLGQDIEATGEKIEEVAEETREELSRS